MTFAASAKRNDDRPSDQRSMDMATITAVAWSTENELDVLCILYVVLSEQPVFIFEDTDTYKICVP